MHMAGSFPEEHSRPERMKTGSSGMSHNLSEEPDDHGSGWYFSRKEIEENSPSRRDGIDLKKEMYLRKAYCTFLQDLGMRLKVPQVAIATAIVFCHRFFLRQSHAKNDRKTIATVCMFLAGKVEETPRPLKDVIVVSYEIIHKADPSAVQKIKQKEVYEQQKELILLGERVVLTTLGFDLNVQHPYKPLVDSIKKFKVAQNALAQVAWNFVNDGLRTSLCLQFEPHHIAAGAIFLAAKFLKVKLPSEGDKVWWQEFDVTPRQLEDVSNQMLELYEQNRAGQSSHQNGPEAGTGDGTNHLAKTVSTVSENSMSVTGPPQDVGTVNNKKAAKVFPPSRALPALSNTEHRSAQNHNNDDRSTDTKSGVWDHSMATDGKGRPHRQLDSAPRIRENKPEPLSCPKSSIEQPVEAKGEASLSKSGRGSTLGDVTTLIDKDKVRAALEKRKKRQNDEMKKTDILDEDDLIERELENGIELSADNEKTKGEKRRGWLEPLIKKQPEIGKKNVGILDHQSFDHGTQNGEEGELSSIEEHGFSSPRLHNEGAESPRKKLRHEVSG